MHNIIHTYIGRFRNINNLMVFGDTLSLKVAFLGLFAFGLLCMPHSAQAQVTLSGTVYSDAGVTPQAVSKTIRVAVGTSTPSVFSTSSSVTTGAWTVTIPTGHAIGTSTPILVWIDGDATNRGQVLTKASTSASTFSINGLDIYKDRVIVRHEAVSGTSTTLSDFSFYTSANDSDVQHSTSSGLLTIASGNELYIWGGDTFAPGSDVRVLGNASASSTDGSMYVGAASVYTASGTLTLGGSLRVESTGSFNTGIFNTVFNATTTGKTIYAPIASIGNLIFTGVGGAWSFSTNATTSDLTILQGTVTAPSTSLGVTGTFQNEASFSANGGTMNVVGAATATLADIVRLTTARDSSGMVASTSPTSTTAFAVAGNTLYVAKAGGSQGCNSTASTSAGNCELMVYNIASTTNPVFVTARDSGGSNASTSNVGINALTVSGSMLYVAKAGSAVPCTQVAGTAVGCEIMVFDISSTTDPIYRAGRDSSGSTNGTSATSTTDIKVAAGALYVSKAAGATTCSTTEGAGAGACEILVFNLSSTTNPLYRTGLDASGSTAAGTQALQVNNMEVVGNTLYAVKAASATACNPTAGNAVGCELMVFSLASTTNPIFATARDAGGSNASTSNVAMNFVVGSGTSLYVAKAASAVPCTEVAGTADGCGIMLFDISSTTNPIYKRGVDAGGSYTGSQALAVNGLTLHRNYLYVAKAASAVACSQSTGLSIGCELMVFDVASSTALKMIAGRDAGGDGSGVQTLGMNAVVAVGDALYVGKAGSGTSCNATAGSAIGCELMVFDIGTPASGLVMGSVTGANALENVTTQGIVEFRDIQASTTNFTILSGTTTAPVALTVGGNYDNNSNFIANEGTIFFDSNSAQSISGTNVANSSFYRTVFEGSGIKTLTSNASTTFVEISSGAEVVAPSHLTVADTFTNNGTFDANNGTLYSSGYFNEFVAGVSAAGSMTDSLGVGFNKFLTVGNIVYAAKAGLNTACSQVSGSAQGCELQVFDISTPSNPIFRAGRDSAGSHASTSATSTTALAVSGNTLYVGKAGGSQGCNSTASTSAGNCELLVFDISSTTNPTFSTARDAGGSSASTSNIGINALAVSGNMLYVAKAGSAVPCTQVAGTADGCELMVFDITSPTNPIYRAGRDSAGSHASTSATSTTALAVSGNTLYVGKAGGSQGCNSTASTSAGNCELLVFDISSTTNPTFITARDSAGSNASTSNVGINSLVVVDNMLYVGKAGSAAGCSQTAGNAAGCEIMVFDISSTTNPVYRAGRDVSGNAAGTGNLAVNFVTGSGTNLYVAKAGNNTVCSQTAGSALGCELMVFDTGSSTNPVYMGGRDADTSLTGQTTAAAQTLLLTGDLLLVGESADTTRCEQIRGLRIGCEFLIFKSPTTIDGTLTGASGLATVTTNGLTKILAAASTTNLTIATSSVLTAPQAPLSVSGNLRIQGGFQHNAGEVTLLGTDQLVSAVATTTFYDFTQITNVPATTTFSTNSPFIIERNLTLSGSAEATLNLRSASTTGQWLISPQSSTTIIARYLNVQDSRNISFETATITCDVGCIDGGNNISWEFIETSSTVNWNATDWTLYDTITIQQENIDSDLTDFPVYVNLADLSSTFWSTTPAGASLVGTDIRVTTADNVEVPRELVFASSSLETGELHFKAPSISSTTDTVFKIWYNGTTTGDYVPEATYGREAVWTNDFVAVYHMNENPAAAAPELRDSTVNAQNATAIGSPSQDVSDLVNAKVGLGWDFELASGQYAQFTAAQTVSGQYTVSAWSRPDAVENGQGVFSNRNSDEQTFDYKFDFNQIHGDIGTGSSWLDTSADQGLSYSAGTWHHVAYAVNSSGYNLYVNNNNNNESFSGTPLLMTAGNTPWIGAAGEIPEPFEGVIDEFRIASTTRSSAWVKAEYVNQSTTTDFYTLDGVTEPEVWNATDWTQFDTITIQQENIDSDLTDFPVYVDLADLSSTFWSTTPAGAALVGTDIRVTTADNVEVPRELVFASSSLETGELHFKAPSISGTTDTIFKIWYNGNTLGDYATTSTYGAQNVWTNDFVGVYHFQEDPSGGADAVIDSSPFGHHGTGGATMTSSDLVAGKVGSAYDFDGGAVTDSVLVGTSSALANLSTVSVCTWYEHDTFTGTYGQLVDKSIDGLDGWNLFIEGPDFVGFTSQAGGFEYGTLSLSNWQYLCAVTNGGTGGAGIAVYKNGVLDESGGGDYSATPDDTNTELSFGAGKSDFFVDGRMDEVRIASTTRTAAWVKAEYYNQSTTTDFYAVNVVEGAQVWNATDWTFFDTITIDAANIDSDLTDFPVYVNLADLSSTFWSTTPAGASLVGTDIRVTTASNVEVPRELVFASSTLETGELHFKAPTISSTTDTVFKIWYNGNTAGDYATTSTYGAQNVWTNEYVAVLHLNEVGNSVAAGYLDSTGNGFNGTGNSMTSGSSMGGKLGVGQDFDGSADYIDLAGSVTLGSTTLSTWINVASADLQTCKGVIFSRGTNTSGLNVGGCSEIANVGYHWNDVEWPWSTGPAVVTNAWSYVALTVGASGATAYSNTASSTNVTSHGTSVLDDIRIGQDSLFGTRSFNGLIDEVRIASTSRSAAWLAAEYRNQATTTDFYTVLAEIVGTSTIANHSDGQISNAFSSQNETDEPLFGFRLTPGSGAATTTNVSFTLSNVRSLNHTDFSNLRIYRDVNSNGAYNGGTDVLVSSAGEMTINGSAGSIVFTEDFVFSAAADYLLVADWSAPARGSFVTINLYPQAITVVDEGGAQVVTGSVDSVNHVRTTGGGGSNNGGVVNTGEPGAGTVGGGSSDPGEELGGEPNFNPPTSNGTPHNQWSSGSDAYTTNGLYASETTAGERQTYGDYGYTIPPGNTITGIEVKLEASATTNAGTIEVALSWDGGTSITSPQTTATLTTTDTIYSLGGSSDLWGRSWSVSDFQNGNFAIRLIGQPTGGNTVRVDAIQVRVYHAASGGGGGGGTGEL